MAWGEREQGAQASNYYDNPTFFTIRFQFYEGAFRGDPVRYIDNVDPQTFSFRQLNRMVRLLGYTTMDYFNAQIVVPGIEVAYINLRDEQYFEFELVSAVGRFHKEVNLRLERIYDSTHNSDGMWERIMPSHTEDSSDESSDEDSEIPDSDIDSEMESDARS